MSFSRDIKQAPANGVGYLLRPMVSHVLEGRDDECAVVVGAEPAKSCSTERPICSRRTPLQVIHAEADCLWLSSVDDVAVGDLVSQLHCAGHKQDLERAFVDAWKQRWDRHRDVSPDRWPVMTDFARAHMPRLQLDWPSLWLLTLSILHLCPKNAQELYCRCEKSSPQCVGESVLHVS